MSHALSNARRPSRDRVLDLRRVRAGDLIPNPKNWRRHPEAQARAMKGMLAEIGWADALIARETPEGLLLLDGHLRSEVAPDDIVPVLVVDLDEKEGDKLLAALDPLAALAEADHQSLGALMKEVETQDAGLQALFTSLIGVADFTLGYGDRPEKDAKENPEALWPKLTIAMPPDALQEIEAVMNVHEGAPWERLLACVRT